MTDAIAPRSLLPLCVPLPRTSLTATAAELIDLSASGFQGNQKILSLPPDVLVYFQDTHGEVCAVTFYLPDGFKGGKPLPSEGLPIEGKDPVVVQSRKLALFAPLNVVQYKFQPFAYFLDDWSVIIEATLSDPQNQGEAVAVHDVNWIDVKAVEWSRLGALSEERGAWVYYERNLSPARTPGREKGIREIWKIAEKKDQYKFTTFHLPFLLSGTDIAAVQIASMRSGSFFYQREDFSIWEHNWDNSKFQWQSIEVLPSNPSQHRATSLTALAAAYNQTCRDQINLLYLTENNEVALVAREAGVYQWSAPKVLVQASALVVPGTRLGATACLDKFFIAFQVNRQVIHGLFYGGYL